MKKRTGTIDKVLRYIQNNFNYTLLGVFAIGSQNYELDTPESDCDTVALVLPSKEDLYFKNSFITGEYVYDNGICKIMDIRTFYKGLLKGSITSLELCCSSYYWVNWEYAEDLMKLEEDKTASRLNKKGVLNCAYGIYNKTLKNLNKTNGNGHFCSYHALRMVNFIHSYIKGDSLIDCFLSQEIFSHEDILAVKTRANGYHLLETKCQEMSAQIAELVNNFCEKNPSIDTVAEQKLKEVFVRILDKHFDFLKK